MRHGFAAALAAFCLSSAQAQIEPPPLDPNVIPAQLRDLANPAPGLVAEPPPPVVRVQVRVPAAIAPQSPVKYTLIVSNVSSVSAHKVRLMHKVPDGAEQPKFDPEPENWDKKSALPLVLVWQFGEMPAGKSRTVTATYMPKADVKQLRAEAFVGFEHGQAVVTQVERPRLTLKKSAPSRAMAGTPVAVRVEIANMSPVPVSNVELLETLPPDAEFRGEGEITKNAGQRVWKLGTLRPGERRIIPYQVVAKGATELIAISAVTGQNAVADATQESRTQIDTASVALALTGPERVEAGGAAEYIATATNTGTMPLDSVQIRLKLPENCQPTAMSAGGRLLRDEIIWDGPPDRAKGPLRANERFEIRCKLRSQKAGERTVEVSATIPGIADQTARTKTAFSGSALLQGRADIAPAAIEVGELGRLKYTVTNSGDGVAKGVVVTVMIPEGVTLPNVPPRARRTGNELQFEAADLVPQADAAYELEFRGDKPAQAVFEFQVTESGGGRGVRMAKEVAIMKLRTAPTTAVDPENNLPPNRR